MSRTMRHSQRGTSRGGKKQSALKLHDDCSIKSLHLVSKEMRVSNLYIPLLPQLSQSSTEVTNLARHLLRRLFKLKRPNVENNGYSNRKCCRSSHLQISSMPIGRIKSKQGLRSVNDPPWQGQGHETDTEMRSVTGEEGSTSERIE